MSRQLNDAAAIHEMHRRGGVAAHKGATFTDPWRAHYGVPPRGDPNRPQDQRCFGCGHPGHVPGQCKSLTYFTHQRCACTESATVPVMA